MKFRVIVKRLSNPRIKRRLKIAVFIWFGGIGLAILFKVIYDIGYFDAQSLMNQKVSEFPTTVPVLTIESAQRIVTGALKEDPSNPQTIVEQVLVDDHRFSTIIIENNGIKKIGRIIDMRFFFSCELYNDEGYNLNEGIEHQYDLNRDNFNRGDQSSNNEK
jgi:hypothetical protein